MYIVDVVDRVVVCYILTNHGLTLYEALEIAGFERDFDDHCLFYFDGSEYYFDDLDITTDPDSYFGGD